VGLELGLLPLPSEGLCPGAQELAQRLRLLPLFLDDHLQDSRVGAGLDGIDDQAVQLGGVDIGRPGY